MRGTSSNTCALNLCLFRAAPAGKVFGYPRGRQTTPTEKRFPTLADLHKTYPFLSALKGVEFGNCKLRPGAFLQRTDDADVMYEVEGVYELGSQPPGRLGRKPLVGIGYYKWTRQADDDVLDASLRLPLFNKVAGRHWLPIDELIELVRPL